MTAPIRCIHGIEMDADGEHFDGCGVCSRNPIVRDAHTQQREARITALEAEVKRLRDFLACAECGEPGVAYLSTEGDGCYWLCASTDTAHAEDRYGWECVVFRFPEADPERFEMDDAALAPEVKP